MSWKATYRQDLSGWMSNNTIWRNDDVGLWAFRDAILTSDYRISSELGVQLQVDGSTPSNSYWYVYNGKRFWSVGTDFLWWDSSKSQWIISARLGSCTAEEWDDSDSDSANHMYIGDSWWSGPSDGSLEGLYKARGSLRGDIENEFNGTPKKITLYFDGWIHSNEGTAPAGEYHAQERTATVNNDGSVDETLTPDPPDDSDIKVLGLPKFSDDKTSNEYIRSFEEVDGNYTYGNIYYHSSTYGWVIGTPESGNGWYEGSEPDVSSSVTFYEKKTENGSLPGTGDLTVSFDEYVIGSNTGKYYLGEAGIWL